MVAAGCEGQNDILARTRSHRMLGKKLRKSRGFARILNPLISPDRDRAAFWVRFAQT
jgi:hypothetical protein